MNLKSFSRFDAERSAESVEILASRLLDLARDLRAGVVKPCDGAGHVARTADGWAIDLEMIFLNLEPELH